MEKKLYELNIDPELKAFMPPLSETEQAALEANIIKNGCRVPLVVWDGTLVDGHHRYNICRRQNIPFAIEEQSFSDKGEAMLWMLQEQRSRRNQGLVARVVMALKCKPILLAKGKENQGHRSDLDPLFKQTKGHDTRKMIAEIADAAPTMVYKIEKIWEAADEETKASLLAETLKVNSVYNKLFPKEKKEKAVSEETEKNRDEFANDSLIVRLNQIEEQFVDGLESYVHKVERLDEQSDYAYALMESLGRIAEKMSYCFGHVSSMYLGDEECDFNFVEYAVKDASALSNDLMEDALYYFSGGMCTPENLSFILQTINGAHRNNLKMLQKAVKRAASDEIEGYTERNALADLLRACTGVGDDKIYAALDLLLSPDHQDE